MNIVALIPARSGSKGIIHKNIKLYKGIPLLAHSIKVAKECKYIKEVYVSTDSQEYANIAIEYGANVTPLRSKDISSDLSPDIDTFRHFISMFENENDYLCCLPDISSVPTLIVHVRPTYPNRTVDLLNRCIEEFLSKYDKYDSLRTVVPLNKTPYKMYHIENGTLIPFIKKHPKFSEPYNQARQHFPTTYLHNGCIDIIKTEIIIKKSLLSGDKILPFIMDENEINDIDDLNDFNRAENNSII